MAEVERYVRLSVAGLLHEDDEYIVGLEFTLSESDKLHFLRCQLTEVIHEAVSYAMSEAERPIAAWEDKYKMPYWCGYDALIAEGLHEAIDDRWPGRAHFIEVQHDNPDGWVQVFQPYGLPQDQ